MVLPVSLLFLLTVELLEGMVQPCDLLSWQIFGRLYQKLQVDVLSLSRASGAFRS